MVNQKVNVHQTIWRLIEKDISIKKSLEKNIVNIRALAIFLIDKFGLRVSVDSVVSALRRYNDNLSRPVDNGKVENLFKNSTIKTKNNVVCLILSRSAPILEFFNKPEIKEREFRVITGEDNIRLMLHNSMIDIAFDFFKEKDVVEKKENLSEIILTLTEKAVQTKGVLARIANEIAIHDINLEELIISAPEFTIYVKQSDLITAHEALFKLNGK